MTSRPLPGRDPVRVRRHAGDDRACPPPPLPRRKGDARGTRCGDDGAFAARDRQRASGHHVVGAARPRRAACRCWPRSGACWPREACSSHRLDPSAAAPPTWHGVATSWATTARSQRRGFRLFPAHNKYTIEDWRWLLAESGLAVRTRRSRAPRTASSSRRRHSAAARDSLRRHARRLPRGAVPVAMTRIAGGHLHCGVTRPSRGSDSRDLGVELSRRIEASQLETSRPSTISMWHGAFSRELVSPAPRRPAGDRSLPRVPPPRRDATRRAQRAAQVLPVSRSTSLFLPAAQRAVWRQMSRALRSRALQEIFKRKFRGALERRFGRSIDRLSFYPVPILLRTSPDTGSASMVIRSARR